MVLNEHAEMLFFELAHVGELDSLWDLDLFSLRHALYVRYHICDVELIIVPEKSALYGTYDEMELHSETQSFYSFYNLSNL